MTGRRGEPVALVLDGDGVDLGALWWRAARGAAPAALLTHPLDRDAHALARGACGSDLVVAKRR
jgi:hypothetical protein